MLEDLCVLAIEDSESDFELLSRRMRTLGSTLVHADRLEHGLTILARGGIDLVILDLHLPDIQGLATLERLREHYPDIPTIVLTGVDDETVGINAVRLGAQDYLAKDKVSAGRLRRALRFALERSSRQLAEARLAEVESQVLQAQRLEAIGTLAAGVAHEINNPLNAIMNYAELIADDVEGELETFSREILAEGERISVIVRDLLTFARQEQRAFSSARIEDIVDSTLTLLRLPLKRDQIDLVVDIPLDLPEIRCRSQQIRQVVLNLINNARDALGEIADDREKVLQISAARCTVHDRAGIELVVADNGPGVAAEVMDRLFDPFFTTKGPDRGTGLGLSVTQGIVVEHGGEIVLNSVPGAGATFHVRLPLLKTNEVPAIEQT